MQSHENFLFITYEELQQVRLVYAPGTSPSPHAPGCPPTSYQALSWGNKIDGGLEMGSG